MMIVGRKVAKPSAGISDRETVLNPTRPLTVKTGVDTELSEAEQPDLPVIESLADVLPVELFG